MAPHSQTGKHKRCHRDLIVVMYSYNSVSVPDDRNDNCLVILFKCSIIKTVWTVVFHPGAAVDSFSSNVRSVKNVHRVYEQVQSSARTTSEFRPEMCIYLPAFRQKR